MMDKGKLPDDYICWGERVFYYVQHRWEARSVNLHDAEPYSI